jgi:hypothetical protein
MMVEFDGMTSVCGYFKVNQKVGIGGSRGQSSTNSCADALFEPMELRKCSLEGEASRKPEYIRSQGQRLRGLSDGVCSARLG